MLADFRQVDNKRIECDLCIVGAGAAGITLARALIDTDIRVCLLESGGFDYEADTQQLYEGFDVGYQQFHDVKNSRLRYFGGTTNHWKGRCSPLTPLDFAVRSWVPHSGWPIDLKHLDAYYRKAQHLCEVGEYRYELADFPQRKIASLPLHPEKFMSRVWRIGPPTRFGSRYRQELVNAANVTIYLHANVTMLETDHAGNRISEVEVRSLNGDQGSVRAKFFVLACGGIENARILLLSNRVEPQGVGNRHDLVGRFLMDQLRLEEAAWVAPEDNRVLNIFGGSELDDGVLIEPIICPAPALQQAQQSLNWVLEFMPMAETGAWADALRDIGRSLKSGSWPEQFGTKVWQVITDLDDAASGLYRRWTARPLSILARCEIAPDPQSRITLISERDALGQHKVQRRLRVTLREKHTLRNAVLAVAEELGRLSAGRVRLADWLLQDNDEWPSPNTQYAGVHHAGTTRMSANPKQGVVNADCRVHGVENLYIGGNSVFVTSGYAHPTLTIVALALRLADHLKYQFRAHPA